MKNPVLQLIKAMIPIIPVLIARWLMIRETTSGLFAVYSLFGASLVAVMGLFVPLSDSLTCVLLFFLCALMTILFENKYRHELLRVEIMMLALICSGYCFLFWMQPDKRIIVASFFAVCFLILLTFVQVGTGKVSSIVKICLSVLFLIAYSMLFVNEVHGYGKSVAAGVVSLLLALALKNEIEDSKKDDFENAGAQTYGSFNLHDLVKMFRHNYRNYMLGVSGYFNGGKQEKIERYVEDMGEDADIAFRQHMVILSQIKEPFFKWLLIAKLSTAQKEKISTSLVVSKNIKLNNVKNGDFSVVIGNLLDNAIEAARESDTKILKIAIFDKNGDTIVSIKNTFKEKPDVSKLFEKGYSKKAGHSGVGLCGVKKIVSMYPNVLMDIRVSDRFFVADLNITENVSNATVGES